MPRIRLKPMNQLTVFHLISRVPQGDLLWEEGTLKNWMRELLWRVAEFSGVEIITYVLMSNHFHILVRVPEKGAADAAVTDAELIRRVGRLNGERAAALLAGMQPEVLRAEAVKLDGYPLNPVADGTVVERWEKRRAQILRRMHDVSEFMKCFKERVTAGYNRKLKTHGTVWGARFKSLVVENRAEVLRAVALYIDLNPVRAGLVEDPKDYRWCGYAEAVAGHRQVREALSAVMEKRDWAEGGPSYRLWLAGKGRRSDEARGKQAMPWALAEEIRSQRGEIDPVGALGQRVRHFTDGGALGGKAFVAEVFAEMRDRLGYRRDRVPHEMAEVSDLSTMVRLRVRGVDE
jgi:putative transposase